eukprot:g2857.t1
MIYDPCLSGNGVAQAEKLRGDIGQSADMKSSIELIVASPLTRAIETAKIAFALDSEAPLVNAPALVCSLHRERLDTSGDVGMPTSELRQRYGDIFQFDDPTMGEEVWWQGGGGSGDAESKTVSKERWAHARQRVAKFQEWLLARPEHCIAVVGHSAFFKSLLGASRKLRNCEGTWRVSWLLARKKASHFRNKMDNGSEEARHVLGEMLAEAQISQALKDARKNQESKIEEEVLSTEAPKGPAAFDNDVVEYAEQCLGMDRTEDAAYFWIAETALSAPLPSGWYSADSEDGFTYFYNDKGESTWDLPFTAVYKKFFLEMKSAKESEHGNIVQEPPVADLEHSRNVDDEQTKVAEAKAISEKMKEIDMLKRQLEEMTLERDGMKEQVANLNERLALSVDENQHLKTQVPKKPIKRTKRSKASNKYGVRKKSKRSGNISRKRGKKTEKVCVKPSPAVLESVRGDTTKMNSSDGTPHASASKEDTSAETKWAHEDSLTAAKQENFGATVEEPFVKPNAQPLKDFPSVKKAKPMATTTQGISR